MESQPEFDEFLKMHGRTKEQFDEDLASVTRHFSAFLQKSFPKLDAYRVSLIMTSLSAIRNGLFTLGRRMTDGQEPKDS